MSNQDRNIAGGDAILAQNSFFKVVAKTCVWLAPPLVLIGLIGIGSAVWAFTRPPVWKFFTTVNNKTVETVPTDIPYVDNARLIQHVTECVNKIYAFDFVHYKEQFETNRQCFTDSGFDQFRSAMEGRLGLVVKNNLVSQAVVTGAPIIVGTASRNGVFMWKLEVPVLITMLNGERKATSNAVLTVIVSRLQPYENIKGIAISQLIEKTT